MTSGWGRFAEAARELALDSQERLHGPYSQDLVGSHIRVAGALTKGSYVWVVDVRPRTGYVTVQDGDRIAGLTRARFEDLTGFRIGRERE